LWFVKDKWPKYTNVLVTILPHFKSPVMQSETICTSHHFFTAVGLVCSSVETWQFSQLNSLKRKENALTTMLCRVQMLCWFIIPFCRCFCSFIQWKTCWFPSSFNINKTGTKSSATWFNYIENFTGFRIRRP
jgi:hypothetical protein